MDSRESPALPQQQPPPVPPGMAAMLAQQPNSFSPNFATTSANTMIAPNSAANASMVQNPRFPFNSVISPSSQPMNSLNLQYGGGSQSVGLGTGGFGIEPAKKKRGRPRKYSPDGNVALGLAPAPSTAAPVNPFSSPVTGQGDSSVGTPASDPPAKRSRGRPPGSGKKQLDALGSFGVGFTPHVILVKAGEDVASKILAFSKQGPRTICILSANGAICNVTLRQPATSGGIVTYEGQFEIISLSGSFLLSESNGDHSRMGGLSISLAGSDGRVLGGGVAGMLVAATQVQVIVGSFIADGKKPKSGNSPVPASNMFNFSAPVAAASPTSRGPSSESSDENGNGSPFNRSSGPYNNASQPVHNMPPMFSNMGWVNYTANMLPN
ncbi:AT-hook motif nuclear-localized protein 8 [Diospyros lotus]|uniref:AT-hook motif nuclear-localized protein 8 n=1 Tax=Diospyros lotus TaxID=55363 RepID=UPI00224D9CE9|nr:AT-hook motif nuclear-localized protein 8 [Diospyros lotus]